MPFAHLASGKPLTPTQLLPGSTSCPQSMGETNTSAHLPRARGYHSQSVSVSQFQASGLVLL